MRDLWFIKTAGPLSFLLPTFHKLYLPANPHSTGIHKFSSFKSPEFRANQHPSRELSRHYYLWIGRAGYGKRAVKLIA
jgi:hypothetical protein